MRPRSWGGKQAAAVPVAFGAGVGAGWAVLGEAGQAGHEKSDGDH